MTILNLKKQIIEVGRLLWQRGYVAANDGNISVRLNEKEILTTVTGVSKGFMNEEMIVKIDMEGRSLERHAKFKPSSEVKMHLEAYRQRPDVHAVVHAHPPYCTSFAVAGIPLDRCVLPEAILILGAVPIAEFGLPSTLEIPEKIRPHLQNSDAILLANHGALTLGTDVMNAYFKMETLEHAAHIVWNAIQLGNVNVLPEDVAERLMALRSNYNLSGKITSCQTGPLTVLKMTRSAKADSKNNLTEEQIEEIQQAILKRLKK
ncbi:class II aldolase/adducin family protein [Calditrichota bacterium GD2]